MRHVERCPEAGPSSPSSPRRLRRRRRGVWPQSLDFTSGWGSLTHFGTSPYGACVSTAPKHQASQRARRQGMAALYIAKHLRSRQ